MTIHCKRLICGAFGIFLLFTLVFMPYTYAQSILDKYGDEPETNSNADLLYEVTSGQILFEKNAYEKAYPASTTKIMTALIALENCEKEEIVTVTSAVWEGIDRSSSIAGLSTGECLSLYDILICLLVASGNEAANAIAIHVAGSIDKFVDMMNAKAQELGCEHTNFVNPSGLHDENHYTCAYDLLLITLEARKYDLFKQIVSMSRATIPPTNKYDKERKFNSTNLLLSNTNTSEYLYSKATGIKTGYTTPAGYCLVSSAQNEDLEFICVVLGGSYIKNDSGFEVNGCYRDTLRLYRWGYGKFRNVDVLKKGQIITETYVDQAKDIDHILLESTIDVKSVLHKDTKIDDVFNYVVQIDENVTAPIEKGEKLGTIILYRKGQFYLSGDLVASSSVEKSVVLSGYAKFKASLKGSNVRYAMTALVVLLVGYIVFVVAYNSWRKKNKRRRRR